MSDGEAQIVVTGAGLTCCLGLNKEDVWGAVRQGRCEIGTLTALEQPAPGREGGQCPEPQRSRSDGDDVLPREVRYLRMAVNEALRQAGLDRDRWPDSSRVGIVLGTTLGGMRAGGAFLRADKPDLLEDFLASRVVQRTIAGLPIEGFSATTCAACASGLSAVAMAVMLLRVGELDVVVAGGYDPVSEYVYAGFNSMRLIASGPPLPFSRHRTGMILGEGTAAMVLERARDAKGRGARPLAAVLGIGETSDAHHLTQPQPTGVGASGAIFAALADAGVAPEEIDMISAHATATPNNDAAECAAYLRVFGERLKSVPVTAFKSHLGHTLGAAGAIELILSMMCMNEKLVAPLANVRRDDVEFEELDVVTERPRQTEINRCITLSLGFGGANACVVLGKVAGESRPPGRSAGSRTSSREVLPADVCITGVGVIAPGCIGNEAYLARLRDAASVCALGSSDRDINEDDLAPLFANARRVRRFSAYVKILLAAATIAMRHARLGEGRSSVSNNRCAAIIGSALGSPDFTERYYAQVVREGIDAANPALFAEGVPNIGSAQMSLTLDVRGPSQTLLGTRTAGLEAIHIAARRIALRSCDIAIVGAAEEHAEIVKRAYGSCGLHRDGHGAAASFGDGAGFISGWGATVIVLESRDHAAGRGARVLAEVAGTCVSRAADASPTAFRRSAARALDAIGRPRHLICSANNTWIDPVEAAAINGRADSVGSIYGYLPEMFAVGPLASVAALVLGRTIPPPLDGSRTSGMLCCDAGGPVREAGVLATDYRGTVAATRLRLPAE